EVQLVESGGGLVQPGGSLKLSCAASGFTLSGSNVHWVRQASGKGLEWVGRIKRNAESDATAYAASMRGRLTISRDDSKNTAFLQMNSLKSDDTAMYYCVIRGDVYNRQWGQGTLVTVSSASPTSPKVFPLSLCSTQPDGNVVIACLVQGFFPQEPLSVTWSESGQGVTARNFPPSQDASGDLYTTSSQLTLPATQCLAGKSVTCHVKHYTNPSQDVTVPCP
nr:Chain H, IMMUNOGLOBULIN A1 HEAVY CHAIN [Homo sapiens]3QNX_B Chain B, Fab fragment of IMMUNOGLOBULIN A1 HEAVY CHAIN [Homo sapiens]3QNY_B Chain B, FAB FRAGMENT OF IMMUNOGLOBULIN A1 HEAVY CHAIN [Homo sapiens]3QNY_D Chain D, FAB FRAGMENT OF IMMUNOGLOBULIN A1 HEAVY CHAIN [Homo sapiens]